MALPEEGTSGQDPANQTISLWADLKALVASYAGSSGAITYIHSNHLGAPEAVTSQKGQLIWQADYAPFGAASVRTAPSSGLLQTSANASGYELNLRLPGQYFDEETGLHYNRQRYYDPQAGAYLSPDPLGHPDGPNAYAYVANRPLVYIDPDGLVLFAFDGTGNDESDQNTLSNVVRFRELYDDGQRYYITGPGTRDPRSEIENPWYKGGNIADLARSFTGKERVAWLIQDLMDYSDEIDDEEVIDIDIVGFSRGAAQARDFANQIFSATKDGWYKYTSETKGEQCQRVNFRFMGLWDTVLSVHSGSYSLAVPPGFSYVAHAVALNEYRSLFPLESVVGRGSAADQIIIERGFLGSHSDIGGGFPEGDLAKVALAWMVDQAVKAGVNMNALSSDQTTIISNPVLHDKSSNLFAENGPAPSQYGEDRRVRFRDGSSERQRRAAIDGMTYADTQHCQNQASSQGCLINYSANPQGNISGAVDMNAYLQWLNDHGYEINMTVQ